MAEISNMQVLDSHTKFAHLGKPGTAFSKGFQRRLDIIAKLVDFKDKKILDMGCGEGVWMHEFVQYTSPSNIFGFDVDSESLSKFEILNSKFETNEQIPNSNIKISTAEDLKFPDNTFDIVFSNEVFEHVEDDRKAAQEVLRVLKPGGKLILFTPNRGWPFETHGMFWRGKYIWGNIPFLPWMPKSIRQKFSPHVRNYSNKDIQNVFGLRDAGSGKNLQLQPSTFNLVYHKHVFPAFDKLERKFGIVGKLFQKFFHLIEKTPLHFFGISHLVVLQKTSPRPSPN